MKSGNDGNQCVSVTKRLRIQYFRDLTNSKDANSVAFICDAFYYGWVVNQINCLEGIPSSCRDVFVENSD